MTDPNLIEVLYEIKEVISGQFLITSLIGFAIIVSLFALNLGRKK